MTTFLIVAALLSTGLQQAPFKLEIVALPYPDKNALPVELFADEKMPKAGVFKAKSLTEFATELNRTKPSLFIAHLEAGAWLGVSCYLEKPVSTGADMYTLASVCKIKSVKDGYEIEAIVSDGTLRSNLTFAGGKFNFREKFRIQPGELHYRTPRNKLQGENILLLFSLSRVE